MDELCFFPVENADFFKTDTYFKRRSVLINLLSQKKIGRSSEFVKMKCFDILKGEKNNLFSSSDDLLF